MTAPGTSTADAGVDDELIERYLRGDLAGADLDAFEIRLLDDPALLARSEEIAQFRDAVRRHGVDIAAKPGLLAGLAAAWRDLFSKPGHAIAFAGCAAIVATASWIILSTQADRAEETLAQVEGERDALRRQLSSLASLSVPDVTYLSVTRGPTNPTPIPPGTGALVALDVPLPSAEGAFDVTLIDRQGNRVASRAGVSGQVDRRRGLLVIARDRLPAGEYQLVVSDGTHREVHALIVE